VSLSRHRLRRSLMLLILASFPCLALACSPQDAAAQCPGAAGLAERAEPTIPIPALPADRYKEVTLFGQQDSASDDSEQEWMNAHDNYKPVLLPVKTLSPTLYQDAQHAYGQGLAMLNSGRCQLSDAAFSRALALDPGHVRALAFRGKARLCLHREDAALADVNRALDLDANDNVVREVRCQLHALISMHTVNNEDDCALVKTLLPDAPPETPLQRLLDQCGTQGVTPDPAGAGACSMLIGTGAASGGDLSDLYALRARAYYAVGQWRQALRDANRALQLDPRNLTAIEVRSRSYRHLGDTPKALCDDIMLMLLEPASDPGRSALGSESRLLLKGRVPDAAHCFVPFTQQAP